MSKAREIAEERLATGEISEEEFDRILGKVNARSQNTHIPQESAATNIATESPTISKKGWLLWMLPVLAILPVRVFQEPVENMSGDWQLVIYIAMGLGVVGAIKWIFGE